MLKRYEDVIKYWMFPHWMEQEYPERVWRGKLSPVSETVVSHLYHDGVVGNNWILFCRQIHQYRIMFAENMRGAGFHVHCVMCGKGYYPDSGQGKDDEFYASSLGPVYGHLGFLHLRSDYIPQ